MAAVKKYKTISIRLDLADYRDLKKKAKAKKLPLASYVKMCTFGT